MIAYRQGALARGRELIVTVRTDPVRRRAILVAGGALFGIAFCRLLGLTEARRSTHEADAPLVSAGTLVVDLAVVLALVALVFLIVALAKGLWHRVRGPAYWVSLGVFFSLLGWRWAPAGLAYFQ